MPTRLIFGREPAFIIAMIYAALMLLSTFPLRGFDENLAALVQVLLTAIATAFAAWQVRPVAPTIFTGVIVAFANLLIRFGVDLTEVQIAGFTGLIATAVTLGFARPQQTPTASPAPVLAWSPPAEDIRTLR